MNLNTKMTAQELEQMIAQMERIFTVVRILDKDLLHKMDVRNGELRSEDCKCYSFWEKGKNCENCAAQRALAMKGQCMKLESEARYSPQTGEYIFHTYVRAKARSERSETLDN